jgi:hypothetical protein
VPIGLGISIVFRKDILFNFYQFILTEPYNVQTSPAMTIVMMSMRVIVGLVVGLIMDVSFSFAATSTNCAHNKFSA